MDDMRETKEPLSADEADILSDFSLAAARVVELVRARMRVEQPAKLEKLEAMLRSGAFHVALGYQAGADFGAAQVALVPAGHPTLTDAIAAFSIPFNNPKKSPERLN